MSSRGGRSMIGEEISFLQQALVSAPVALLLVGSDGKIQFVNEQGVRLFGYGGEELLGADVQVLVPERLREAHAQYHRNYFDSPVDHPLGNGLEFRGLHRDGREFPIEISVSPFETPQGTLAVTAIRDISDRRQAEKTLRQGEESLTRILESTRAMPWTADVNSWLFTYVGPQAVELLGYPCERWYEDGFWIDQIHPDDREFAIDYCARSTETGSNYEFEYRMKAADGRWVWIHDMVNVVLAKGKPSQLRGFMIDITSRKEMEAQLRQSEAALRSSEKRLQELAGKLLSAQEEERRRLARELHDDLTQRLAGLAGMTGHLRQQLAPHESAAFERQLGEVHDELVRLSGDVHAVSRELHPSMLEHLGLEDAIRWECESFSSRSGVETSFTSHDVPPNISKDLGICLYRIAQEALNNVARHADTDKAMVSLGREDAVLELVIRDSGVGFDKSSRISTQGIGLESMTERARLVQAELSIESGPGQGTSVLVRAPISEAVAVR